MAAKRRYGACKDILGAGAKTHNAELRLTKFLIKNLAANACFFDIGAHVGFYALLASQITKGKIVAIEPNSGSFALLKKNTAQFSNIIALNCAISDFTGEKEFTEMPAMYSEFSAFDDGQYSGQAWHKAAKVKKTRVRTLTGGDLVKKLQIEPDWIKIDVESAEFEVVVGFENYLTNHAPVVIMEYLKNAQRNGPYTEADAKLIDLGFRAHKIEKNGDLSQLLDTTHDHIQSIPEESDNIVYIKR
jgi:FkbM family methyltransferase